MANNKKHSSAYSATELHTHKNNVKGWHKWWQWLWRKRWYIVGGLALLFLLLCGMAASAKAPGDFGYPVKRAIESIGKLLSLTPDAKTEANFTAATNRVNEAAVVADRIQNESPAKQVDDAQTIQNLLNEFTQTFNDQSSYFSRLLDQGIKIPQDKAKWAETGMVNTYSQLERLRLESPPESQSAVLQAINTMQISLATVQDALIRAPVTPTDVTELTKLVGQGFLTSDEFTQLLRKATSNRQLLGTLRGLVQSGQIPATALYAINYDLLTEIDPKNAPRFVASVEFDEIRKSAILAKVVVPTAEQKQNIQNYLSSYKYGQLLPRDASRSYIMPIIYGLNLTPNLADDLKKLDPNALSPIRKTLYDAWKPLTTNATADAKQLYSQVLQLTDTAIARNPTFLERIQLELLNALRSDVAYLALPPGWTGSQVASMQKSFQQQISDLKSLSTIQTTSQTATATLAQITTPLIAPLTEQHIDAIRVAVEKQMAMVQQQLIATANAAAAPQAIVPDLTKQLADVQQNFSSQIAALSGTNNIDTQEIEALKTALQQSIQSATDAKNQLGQYVVANAALQLSLQQSIADAQAAQNQALSTMQNRLAVLGSANQTLTNDLASSVSTIQQTVNQNVASLQDQLKIAKNAQADTQSKLEQGLIAQINQVAELKAQLNLSDTARNALKAETAQIISQVKDGQSASVTAMQKQINDVGALHSQLSSTTSQQISDIKTAQTQLLVALQNEVGDKDLLKDQLNASINTLKTTQDQVAAKMQSMATSGTSLSTQLDAIKTILGQAQDSIKSNVADTKVARSELQQSIDVIQAAQVTTQKQVNDGIATLGVQLRQAVGEVGVAQSQIKLDLASLVGNVTEVKDAVTDIKSVQLGLQSQLQAQAQAGLDLRHQLEQPIALLQQAQVATQSQVDGLSTNVSQLKNSVSAITTTQQTTQAQVAQLLNASLNWSNIPTTLQFNQDQFKQYEQQLADEFAAKAAAIQQQFDSYKQQLDGSIQQLRGDVNSQLQQLKDSQSQLETQLKAAQDQVKQLQSVPTTTTAPVTITAPTTTVPAAATPTPTTTAPSTTTITTTTTPSLPGF